MVSSQRTQHLTTLLWRDEGGLLSERKKNNYKHFFFLLLEDRLNMFGFFGT